MIEAHETVELKAKHGDSVEFIGFPCDQFGHGDPEGNDAIQNFCAVNYGVSFPVLGKTIVNGDSAAPLYQWMKDEMPGIMGIRRVKWNFEKFLIDRHGKVVRRWASTSNAETLKPAISQALAV
jgi:glutathione peroxidase-family protein